MVKYLPFIDYKTGKRFDANTQFYWKPLSELFFAYEDHKEQKYDGDIGVLTRKHVCADNVIHIGKESNNLDETEAIGVCADDYVIYDNASAQKLVETIRKMTNEDARKAGISRTELWYLKRKVREGKVVALKSKTLKKLIPISI